MRDIPVDTVFLGSCTNGRIEDLRAAADRAPRPDGGAGSAHAGRARIGARAARAEAEGLDQVFTAAGAEWRQAGCSMCLGMNPDQLAPGERSASTSNRNFEGRQGKGGRTHLVSPAGRGCHRRRRAARLARRPRRTCPAAPTTGGPHGAVHRSLRHRPAAAAQQRRHRPDHPRGLSQADHPPRLRGRALRRLAQDPDFVLVRPEYVGATILVAGPNFGTRIIARARGVGAR